MFCKYVPLDTAFCKAKVSNFGEVQYISFFSYGSCFFSPSAFLFSKEFEFSILHLSPWSVELVFVEVRRRLKVSCLVGCFGFWVCSCPSSIVEKPVLPPLNCFCTFVRNGWAYLCGSVSGPGSVPRSLCPQPLLRTVTICTAPCSLTQHLWDLDFVSHRFWEKALTLCRALCVAKVSRRSAHIPERWWSTFLARGPTTGPGRWLKKKKRQ